MNMKRICKNILQPWKGPLESRQLQKKHFFRTLLSLMPFHIFLSCSWLVFPAKNNPYLWRHELMWLKNSVESGTGGAVMRVRIFFAHITQVRIFFTHITQVRIFSTHVTQVGIFFTHITQVRIFFIHITQVRIFFIHITQVWIFSIFPVFFQVRML